MRLKVVWGNVPHMVLMECATKACQLDGTLVAPAQQPRCTSMLAAISGSVRFVLWHASLRSFGFCIGR